jgi:ubiquitin thioesterase OTU1
MENLELKIRHPGGQFLLSHLANNSSLHDLKSEISKKIKEPITSLLLRYGFPPQILKLADNTTLENSGIESGMNITVEIDPTAAKVEPISTKPSVFKDQLLVTDQIPNPDGLIMIRRVIPADNSCLFNCVGYCLENKAKNRGKELREVIVGYVMSEPDKYTDAFLFGKSNEEYCEWILKDASWGGAIELEVFSRHFQTEICAVDISSLVPNIFGSDGNYDNRVYVLYDGLHYDVIARNISDDMEEAYDTTVFSPKDNYAFEGAMALARDLHQKKQFTDTGSFSIQCGVCYQKLKGEKEALDHSKSTGHSNFQEVQSH